jgi:hypothetical protein
MRAPHSSPCAKICFATTPSQLHRYGLATDLRGAKIKSAVAAALADRAGTGRGGR